MEKPDVKLFPDSARMFKGFLKREGLNIRLLSSLTEKRLEEDIEKGILSLDWGCNLVVVEFDHYTCLGVEMVVIYMNLVHPDSSLAPGNVTLMNPLSPGEPEVEYVVETIVRPAVNRQFGPEVRFEASTG